MPKVFRIALIAVFVSAAHQGAAFGRDLAGIAREAAGTVVQEQDSPAEPAQAAFLDSLSAAADSLARTADSLKALLDSLYPEAAAGLKAPSEETAAQKTEAEDKKKSPWGGSLGFGLTMNRGNSRQSSLVSNLDLSRTGEKTRFIHQTTITKTSSDEAEDASRGSFNSKYELNQSKRFFYFTALDLDYNRQAGIDFRMAPGLGVGISAITSDRCRLNFNFGVNIVTEYLRDRPNRTNGRYLGSQDLRITLGSRTRLDQSLTFKPRFDKTEEYLLDTSVSITSNLTSSFDLKLNFESNYSSRPPIEDPPIKRHDWMFYTAIAYNIW